MAKKSAVIGRQMEELAAAWLAERGYEILQRNFRGGGGELDIVCRRGGVIYFVEVKARRAGSRVSAVEAVTADKRRRLYGAAAAWLQRNIGFEAACGFLLLAIQENAVGELEITLLEDFLRW